ncbi:MFS transporter alpha-ketoglutarate permease [Amycolatopsis mediterranei S699]|uniref:Putative proline/betaine transporter n=2 Tax=Amycolatopsis mediterranei TaxID=33910 RepID=A0A0H3D9F0_AMYMU|nr:MFS transporter [Amycolatopsis mediterranei]ADJ46708.1 MFS transporter, alpha-ketoglutarate permease [Amycolatopsis mediterranei U32]AEK43510.1 MFS transporter alpha-ketoglutarate permease [Amycolatopsis mediterranei S699]AFO78419.1 MFS transporter alpha-ketoglutarate permease [Amycolatopsis mediterranei S699]AGT85547.1 MFS transporter alpha-ketoglutarate permease [Amycolatopsis mediterranei RB]KDO11390.1 alpha-ketoglutarate transporter [Amycolatopsis mediterranei]
MTTRLSGAAPAAVSEKRVIGNVLRGSIGNLIEWYDWYAYAAFTTYFAKSFFPTSDTTAAFLGTAAVFAVGFLMRPLGGWMLGRFADRFGRRRALVLSVTLMAGGSLLIAVTPSYHTIGIAAPILLLTARLIQGLSVGGEYSTSATYLSEVATPGKRGFYSSFQYVTLYGGQLLALGLQLILQALLTEQQLTSWGWRIAFGVGTVAALTVMWLRRGMDESESYQREAGETTGERGTLRALAKYPKEIALVVGLTLGGTVGFYTFATYSQKFLENTAHIPRRQVTIVLFCAILVAAVLQPVFGRLSDRIGRRPLLLFFGIGGTLLTVPLMTIMGSTRNPVGAFFLVLAGLVVVAGYTSINAIVKAELFPTKIRALGVGLPYALTVAIFGGTAELIAQALKSAGHEPVFFWYVAGCVLVSLIVYGTMRETSKTSELEERREDNR